MRLFLVLAFVLVGLTAQASTSNAKKVELLSEETVQLTAGAYNLKTVCIAASDYSSMTARNFCLDDAATINMLSTDQVMMGANCQPDLKSRCHDFNAYLLQTRMSIF